MKKILVLVMAILMLLPVLAACNTTPATTPSDTTPEDNGDDTTPVIDGDPEYVVPDGRLDYTVKVMSRKNDWVAWDIVYDDSDEPMMIDTLNNAIKKRNDTMYDLYGVDFQNIAGSVYDEFTKQIGANKNEYDLFLPTIADAGQLAQKGYLIPMSGLEYVDSSMPWYDQRCLDELKIKGENFFFFSDVTAVDLDAIWAYFFNHELITKYNLEDPYTLVANYKWTLDKMIEMCLAVTEDTDGNPTKEDSWGLVGHDYNITAFYIGSGEKIAKTNEKGEIYLSMNDNAGDVQNLINSIISMQPTWCRYALSRTHGDYGNFPRYGFDSDDNYPEIVQVFTSGNALFMGEVLSTLREFADYDMKIGVLPTPMFKASQKEYYCAVNNVAPVMCVPTTCEDTERISIIIEAWSAISRQTLLPAYYDNCMTTRYAKDVITPEILDMIFESRTYDLGIYYGWGELSDRFRCMVYNGKTDFSSLYAKCDDLALIHIKNFMKYFN